MNWIRNASLMAIIGLTFTSLSGVAAAQPAPTAIGKNGDVELTAETRIGATALKPGHYRFRHATQDGQHYLVINQRGRAAIRQGDVSDATGRGWEIARVPCEIVPLDATAKNTAMYITRQPDGSQVITQIRIRGERGGHLLALEPKTGA